MHGISHLKLFIGNCIRGKADDFKSQQVPPTSYVERYLKCHVHNQPLWFKSLLSACKYYDPTQNWIYYIIQAHP